MSLKMDWITKQIDDVEREINHCFPEPRKSVVVTSGHDCPNPHATTIFGNYADNKDDILCRPWGIASDPKTNLIVVCDRGNQRIVIFDRYGELHRKIGSAGSEPGKFQNPTGVTVDPEQRVIVADKDNNRIQIFTVQGDLLMVFGQYGKKAGHFNSPSDVASNSKSEIAVADSKNFRVQLFTRDGVVLKVFNLRDSPHLYPADHPRNVAFTPEGDIVVTTFSTTTISLISRDGSGTQLIGALWKVHPNQKIEPPNGLAVDDDGNIVITEVRNHQIQVMTRDGSLKRKFSISKAGVYWPAGITLMSNGSVALVDYDNGRVVIF